MTTHSITAAEAEDGLLAALLRDALELPAAPADVRRFGEVIESVKLMLGRLGDAAAGLKERAALIRARHADEVREDKSFTNDALRRREVARRCDDDLELLWAEERLASLTESLRRWDARRSRLNREFEVARVDHESRLRKQDADYLANRLRSAR